MDAFMFGTTVSVVRSPSRWRHPLLLTRQNGRNSGGSYSSDSPGSDTRPQGLRTSTSKTELRQQDYMVLETIGLMTASLLRPPSCLALTDSGYDPSKGSEFLVNAAGVGYVLLLCFFLYRVLTKRAKRFTEERAAETPSTVEDVSKETRERNPEPQRNMTVMDGLIGVLQSGAITTGMFVFTTKVDSLLLSVPLPEQYTAQNIAITFRTLIRGFSYLFTFVFGMNFIGLTGLTINLLIDPGSVNKEPDPRALDNKPQLPRISVISDPDEIDKAFDKAENKTDFDSPL